MNIKINLLPDAIIQQRRDARIKQLLNYSLIGWFGVLALISGGLVLMVSSNQSNLDDLTAQKIELNNTVNSPTNVAFRLEAKQVQTALNSVDSLLNGDNKPSEMLDTMAASIPDDVALKEITVADDGGIFLRGNSIDYESIAEFAAGLNITQERYESSPEFGYFFDTNIQQAVASDDNLFSFTITTSYSPAIMLPADISEPNSNVNAIDGEVVPNTQSQNTDEQPINEQSQSEEPNGLN